MIFPCGSGARCSVDLDVGVDLRLELPRGRPRGYTAVRSVSNSFVALSMKIKRLCSRLHERRHLAGPTTEHHAFVRSVFGLEALGPANEPADLGCLPPHDVWIRGVAN